MHNYGEAAFPARLAFLFSLCYKRGAPQAVSQRSDGTPRAAFPTRLAFLFSLCYNSTYSYYGGKGERL